MAAVKSRCFLATNGNTLDYLTYPPATMTLVPAIDIALAVLCPPQILYVVNFNVFRVCS